MAAEAPSMPNTPGGIIKFNKNIIDGQYLLGGYLGFQVYKGGTIVRPVTGRTPRALTLSAVDSLFLYKDNDTYDLYLAGSNMDFIREETVELDGPYRLHGDPKKEYILMRGQENEQLVQFDLVTSTTPDPETPISSKGSVDFNRNIVSGAKLLAGYSGFQLWPKGARVYPAGGKTDTITLSNVTSLFCYGQDDKYDLYLAEANTDFASKQTVELSGPISTPKEPNISRILMKGADSEQLVSFVLDTSTIRDASPKI